MRKRGRPPGGVKQIEARWEKIQARRAQGLSQVAVAAEFDIDPRTVRRLEDPWYWSRRQPLKAKRPGPKCRLGFRREQVLGWLRQQVELARKGCHYERKKRGFNDYVGQFYGYDRSHFGRLLESLGWAYNAAPGNDCPWVELDSDAKAKTPETVSARPITRSTDQSKSKKCNKEAENAISKRPRKPRVNREATEEAGHHINRKFYIENLLPDD